MYISKYRNNEQDHKANTPWRLRAQSGSKCFLHQDSAFPSACLWHIGEEVFVIRVCVCLLLFCRCFTDSGAERADLNSN